MSCFSAEKPEEGTATPFRLRLAIRSGPAILVAFLFLGLLVSTPPQRLTAFAAYAGLLLWLTALSGLQIRGLCKRALLVLPFAVLSAFWLPFAPNGAATIDIAGIPLSVAGLWILAGVVTKSYLGALAAGLLLTALGERNLWLGMLMLRVPVLFLNLLILTRQFLSVLQEEMRLLLQAARARGYCPRRLAQAFMLGRLAGSLFLRGYERSERVFYAMRLRGYHPDALLVRLPQPAALPRARRICDAILLSAAAASVMIRLAL